MSTAEGDTADERPTAPHAAVPSCADVIVQFEAACTPAGSRREMNDHEELTAPIDGLAVGRLVVRRGLGNATLVGDEALDDLFSVRCTGRAPRVRCSGGTVELTSPLIPFGGRTHTEISLNGSLPWEIEIAGGATDVRLDFTRLIGRSIDVDGGVTQTVLDLSAPDGTTVIRLGAVSDTTIRRPAGVPVRLQVRRDARRVALDDRLIDDCGPTTLTTAGYDRAVNRVDVSVDSAVDLAVTTADLTRDAPAGPVEVMAAAHTWLARMRAGRVVWPAPDVA
jgi:hypothetical protein